MDNYEQEIARCSGNPFSNRQERRTIRCAAQNWVNGQRYKEEQRRRLGRYVGWVALATPLLVAGIKVVEAYWK